MWIANKCSMLGMTVDTKQQRMFVAEFGNNRLAVVDLPAGKVLPTIAGLREPQGVAYVSFADSGFVPAMASLRMLRGEDLTPIRRIDPGDNAGNMRVDAAATGCSWVTAVRAGGNRSGKRTKTADIRLKGHPEGFNIDEVGTQVFINVLDAREIEVLDLAAGSHLIVADATGGIEFPDGNRRRGARVFVVFRSPRP